jgi:hypothetical protein
MFVSGSQRNSEEYDSTPVNLKMMGKPPRNASYGTYDMQTETNMDILSRSESIGDMAKLSVLNLD